MSKVFTQFYDGLPVDINKEYYICDYGAKDTGLQEIHKYCLFPFNLYLYLNLKEINAKTTNRYTPLMIASANNVYESVKLLLENGVDLNTQNKYGNTALIMSYANIKITKILLEYGVDIYIQDIGGWSIIDHCLISSNICSIKLLLQYIDDLYILTSLTNRILTSICTILSNIDLYTEIKSIKKLNKFDYNSILLYELKKCVFSQAM